MPAVLFGVLGQGAVGAFWTILVVRAWVAGMAGPRAAGELTDPSLPWVAGSAAVALLFGLVDLLQRRSGGDLGGRVAGLLWTAAFAIAAGISAAVTDGALGRPSWAMTAEVAASAAGLLLLWTASSSFSGSGVEAWRGWTTPALLSATALQLGILGAAAALVPGDAPDELAGEVYGYLALWGLGAVLLGILALAAWLRRLAPEGEREGATGRRLLAEHRRLLGARAAFSGLAASACALAVLWDSAVGPAVLAGAALAFAGELCGRTLLFEAGSLGDR